MGWLEGQSARRDDMKEKIGMWLDLGIGSLNYILINYALSNMAMLFRSHWLFILFFASEIWVWNGIGEWSGKRLGDGGYPQCW